MIARAGDRDAVDTLVVLAHHDAPQTGLLFDQTLQRRLHELAPGLLERIEDAAAAVVDRPRRAAVHDRGAASRAPAWSCWAPVRSRPCYPRAPRGLARDLAAPVCIGALGSALVADVWRSRPSPGANDNLSGVAALVALAELLAELPPAGLRVLLVSCGAEETLQDGVRAFLAHHRHELDSAGTLRS